MNSLFENFFQFLKSIEVHAQQKTEKKRRYLLNREYLHPLEEPDDEESYVRIQDNVTAIPNISLKRTYEAAKYGMKEGVLTGLFIGGCWGILRNLKDCSYLSLSVDNTGKVIDDKNKKQAENLDTQSYTVVASTRSSKRRDSQARQRQQTSEKTSYDSFNSTDYYQPKSSVQVMRGSKEHKQGNSAVLRSNVANAKIPTPSDLMFYDATYGFNRVEIVGYAFIETKGSDDKTDDEKEKQDSSSNENVESPEEKKRGSQSKRESLASVKTQTIGSSKKSSSLGKKDKSSVISAETSEKPKSRSQVKESETYPHDVISSIPDYAQESRRSSKQSSKSPKKDSSKQQKEKDFDEPGAISNLTSSNISEISKPVETKSRSEAKVSSGGSKSVGGDSRPQSESKSTQPTPSPRMTASPHSAESALVEPEIIKSSSAEVSRRGYESYGASKTQNISVENQISMQPSEMEKLKSGSKVESQGYGLDSSREEFEAYDADQAESHVIIRDVSDEPYDEYDQSMAEAQEARSSLLSESQKGRSLPESHYDVSRITQTRSDLSKLASRETSRAVLERSEEIQMSRRTTRETSRVVLERSEEIRMSRQSTRETSLADLDIPEDMQTSRHSSRSSRIPSKFSQISDQSLYSPPFIARSHETGMSNRSSGFRRSILEEDEPIREQSEVRSRSDEIDVVPTKSYVRQPSKDFERTAPSDTQYDQYAPEYARSNLSATTDRNLDSTATSKSRGIQFPKKYESEQSSTSQEITQTTMEPSLSNAPRSWNESSRQFSRGPDSSRVIRTPGKSRSQMSEQQKFKYSQLSHLDEVSRERTPSSQRSAQYQGADDARSYYSQIQDQVEYTESRVSREPSKKYSSYVSGIAKMAEQKKPVKKPASEPGSKSGAAEVSEEEKSKTNYFKFLPGLNESIVVLSACNCAIVLGVLCSIISITKASFCVNM